MSSRPSHHAHSFVIAIEGRKGTRNYARDDTGETTESGTSAEKPRTREEKIKACMATWDTKTHITKADWRKICERQLEE